MRVSIYRQTVANRHARFDGMATAERFGYSGTMWKSFHLQMLLGKTEVLAHDWRTPWCSNWLVSVLTQHRLPLHWNGLVAIRMVPQRV